MDVPSTRGTLVLIPVVESRWFALPEFNEVWNQYKTAPMLRTRDGIVGLILSGQLLDCQLQRFIIGDNLRLWRGNRAESASDWTGLKVFV